MSSQWDTAQGGGRSSSFSREKHEDNGSDDSETSTQGRVKRLLLACAVELLMKAQFCEILKPRDSPRLSSEEERSTQATEKEWEKERRERCCAWETEAPRAVNEEEGDQGNMTDTCARKSDTLMSRV
ncbi:hypothetical protein CgunFtcFv8_009765 [Champsocephalus gunnari]|uniref:Uncharacterized protein n=1 Tax=Champsocephalus gunnari TaxID=52237 RepID=A0AAN8C245_CHAGU|nr:hypothetical protein CgunFtcFv8_009765 [Champsocephalus gunnari]